MDPQGEAGRAVEESLAAAFPSRPGAEIDTDALRAEWTGLGPAYPVDRRRMPLPVWARRGLPDNGPRAWDILSREAGGRDPAKPFCIYIHIPFCAEKCGFCDCYSFRLARHRDEHIQSYRTLLRRELESWSALGNLSRRPVSTVHFGGGTPTFLGREAFLQLAADCRSLFAAGPQTEWALETTSTEWTEEMADGLAEAGVCRLHFGVQSLDPAVRSRIQRRESPEAVLAKIRRAAETESVVSVDIIVGLPGQNAASLLRDIRRLAEAGVEGFSVYELQYSSRNRKFRAANPDPNDDPRLRYLFFQAAAQTLTRLGYRKTLFNHFSRERDANLYFTFPQRGEDCLAAGTIADGVFGDYHYRHPPYAEYNRLTREGFPGLQGGIRRDARENALHPVITAILSGTFPPDILRGNAHLPAEANAQLMETWRANRLVAPVAGGNLELTGNGSWFAGNMIDDLLRASY